MPRDFNLYINDIIESIESIYAFTKGMTLDQFSEDLKSIHAVRSCFQIIGEAVKKLPTEFTNQYPGIPWAEIRDMRNIIVHEYFGVDLSIVWESIKEDLPELYKKLKDIK